MYLWQQEKYNPKAVHYEAKRFNAPQTVIILSEKRKRKIVALNDTLSDADFNVTYGLKTFDGKTVYEQTRPVSLKAGESKDIAEIDLKDHGKNKNATVFAVLATKDGKEIASRCHTAEKEKKCDLPDPKISVSTSFENGIYKISLTAKAYARGIEIMLKGIDGEFSDNFFDLPAGGKACVTIPIDGADKKYLDSVLRVRSLYDIKRKQSSVQDNLFAAKVFLEPFNLVNWIYRTQE